MNNFHIGQKVICVNTDLLVPNTEDINLWLKEGDIYQIRWIGECPHLEWRHFGPGVRLNGVVRIDPHWGDFPFAACRFRPAIERKTSIEIFTRMLAPTSKPLIEVE